MHKKHYDVIKRWW